jgi:hypothetical protein
VGSVYVGIGLRNPILMFRIPHLNVLKSGILQEAQVTIK